MIKLLKATLLAVVATGAVLSAITLISTPRKEQKQ